MKNPNIISTSLIPIGGRRKVNPLRVIALVADVNYTLAHLDDGQVIIVATPLKTLAARFQSATFFRTHKSFMINMSYVVSYDEEHHLFVDMPNNLRANIARRKRTAFRISFQNFKLK